MRDRILLGLYLLIMMALGMVHMPLVFVAVFAVTFVLAGKMRFILLKRAFLALLFFAVAVDIGYILMSFFKPLALDALIVINLRVFAMTYLTFTMVEKVNIAKALAFSPGLSRLYVISVSNIMQFQRMWREFMYGLESRNAGEGQKNWFSRMQMILFFFVNKSIHHATDNAMGLRSRGVFDD